MILEFRFMYLILVKLPLVAQAYNSHVVSLVWVSSDILVWFINFRYILLVSFNFSY